MIDIEQIKREVFANIPIEDICVANATIDYLHSRGYLGGVPKDILEPLHQKAVHRTYEYQCGYLDCLNDAKGLIAAAPKGETK